MPTISPFPANLRTPMIRKRIIIDHTKVIGGVDFTDFPLLFKGTYSFFATLANGGSVINENGYDIFFTSDAQGNNLLDFEKKYYLSTDGSVVYWVRVPTLLASVDTTIYVWFKNTLLNYSIENIPGVWNSSFLRVFHLNEDSGHFKDSTINTKDSTTEAGLTFGNAGKIYKCPTATSGFAIRGSDLGLPTGIQARAMFGWLKGSSVPDFTRLFEYGSTSNNQLFSLLMVSTGALIPSQFGQSFQVGLGYADDNWHRIGLSYDPTNKYKVWADGQNLGGGDMTTDTHLSGSIALGAQVISAGNNWPGSIEHFTFLNQEPTDGFVATEFNNQNSPETFYQVID